MTALVGHDPEAGSKETLDDGVPSPQRSSDGSRRNGLGSHVVMEEVEGGR